MLMMIVGSRMITVLGKEVITGPPHAETPRMTLLTPTQGMVGTSHSVTTRPTTLVRPGMMADRGLGAHIRGL